MINAASTFSLKEDDSGGHTISTTFNFAGKTLQFITIVSTCAPNRVSHSSYKIQRGCNTFASCGHGDEEFSSARRKTYVRGRSAVGPLLLYKYYSCEI